MRPAIFFCYLLQKLRVVIHAMRMAFSSFLIKMPVKTASKVILSKTPIYFAENTN